MKILYSDVICTNKLEMENNAIFPTVEKIESQIRQARSTYKKQGYATSGYNCVLSYDVPHATFRFYVFSAIELIPKTSTTFIPIPIYYKDPLTQKVSSVHKCAEMGLQKILITFFPDDENQ